jgi:hypothetical protein
MSELWASLPILAAGAALLLAIIWFSLDLFDVYIPGDEEESPPEEKE